MSVDDIMRERIVKMRKQFGNVVANTIMILEDYPETRSNDNLLCFRYWERFERLEDRAMTKTLNYAFISLLTPVESITRARRKIQNDMQLYQAPKKVREERAIREAVMPEVVKG